MRATFFAVTVTGLCGSAVAQQAKVNLDFNPQKNTENLVPFRAPLNSPDVRDDRTVTFRLKAPEARRVELGLSRAATSRSRRIRAASRRSWRRRSAT